MLTRRFVEKEIFLVHIRGSYKPISFTNKTKAPLLKCVLTFLNCTNLFGIYFSSAWIWHYFFFSLTLYRIHITGVYLFSISNIVFPSWGNTRKKKNTNLLHTTIFPSLLFVIPLSRLQTRIKSWHKNHFKWTIFVCLFLIFLD